MPGLTEFPNYFSSIACWWSLTMSACDFLILTPEEGHDFLLLTTRDPLIAAGAILKISPSAVIHAESPADETQRSLWHAMAVCNSCGFPEHLPVEIAGICLESARLPIQHLIEAGLVDRLDHEILRLHDVSRLAALKDADLAQLRRRHARVVHDSFCLQMASRDALIAEAPIAIDYACLAGLAIGHAPSRF